MQTGLQHKSDLPKLITAELHGKVHMATNDHVEGGSHHTLTVKMKHSLRYELQQLSSEPHCLLVSCGHIELYVVLTLTPTTVLEVCN